MDKNKKKRKTSKEHAKKHHKNKTGHKDKKKHHHHHKKSSSKKDKSKPKLKEDKFGKKEGMAEGYQYEVNFLVEKFLILNFFSDAKQS